MRNLLLHCSLIRSTFLRQVASLDSPAVRSHFCLLNRHFSVKSGDDVWNSDWKEKPVVPDLGWDESASSWSTGLTADHFDGTAVGKRQESTNEVSIVQEETQEDFFELVERDNRKNREFVDGWGSRMKETVELLKQVREPGARGSYLKDSEKSEMYRLHKENPDEYSVERLAKDYRIMRQRVHAILWLKEIEEEEEKKLGGPLDDSVEQLLDACPE